MKKRLLYKTAFVFLITLMMPHSSSAVINIDFGATAAEINAWITRISENATKAIQPVVEQYQSIKKGIHGAIESSEAIQKGKELYEAGKEKFQEAKKAYSETKKEVDKYKGEIEAGKAEVEQLKQEAESKVQEVQAEQKKVEEKKASLQEELSKVKEEREQYLQDEKASLEADIKTLEDNIAVYKQAEAQKGIEDPLVAQQVKESESQIAELKKVMAELPSSDAVREYDTQIESLEAQISDKNDQIAAIAITIGGLVAGTVGGTVKNAVQNALRSKSEAAYAKAIDENFIPEGAIPGGEALDKIARNRRIEALKATLDAYEAAIQIKQNMAKMEEQAEENRKKAAEMEDMKGRGSMEVSGIRVEAMQNFLDTIKLMTVELKMQTALDMMSVPPEYQYKSKFNFDDYIFTEDDAKRITKKNGSLIDKGKDLVNKGNDLVNKGKEAINKGTEMMNDVKDIGSDVKEAVGGVGDSVKSVQDQFSGGN